MSDCYVAVIGGSTCSIYNFSIPDDYVIHIVYLIIWSELPGKFRTALIFKGKYRFETDFMDEFFIESFQVTNKQQLLLLLLSKHMGADFAHGL